MKIQEKSKTGTIVVSMAGVHKDKHPQKELALWLPGPGDTNGELRKPQLMASLSGTHARILVRLLEGFVIYNINMINNAVAEFKHSGKSYSLTELSDEVVVSIRPAHNSSTGTVALNVGFPFPIYTEKFSNAELECGSLDIQIFLRGERIRNLQRIMLMDLLDGDVPLKWNEVGSVREFRELTKRTMAWTGNVLYVDAYTYIGDSIIGLHFLDAFVKDYGIDKKNVRVLSRAYKHIDGFYPSAPCDPKELSGICDESSVVIMPDLIDSHWGKRLELIDAIKDREVFVLVVSRNLAIKLGKKREVWHLSSADPLLRESNIEDYMNDCLLPFVDRASVCERGCVARPSAELRENGRIALLGNALSSLGGKDLPPEKFLDLCKKMLTRISAPIYVSAGVRESAKDVAWVAKFSSLLAASDNRVRSGIRLLYDNGLTDLAERCRELDVSLVFSVDTSLPHLFNRLGVPTIAIYKKAFWDDSSLQSLASDSPLGFCRYGGAMYPAVFDEREDNGRFADLMAECAVSLIGDGLCEVHEGVQEFIRDIERLAFARRDPKISGLRERNGRLVWSFERLRAKYKEGRNAWMFELFDPASITENVMNFFPAPRTADLVSSSWLISPAYKWFKFDSYRKKRG